MNPTGKQHQINQAAIKASGLNTRANCLSKHAQLILLTSVPQAVSKRTKSGVYPNNKIVLFPITVQFKAMVVYQTKDFLEIYNYNRLEASTFEHPN